MHFNKRRPDASKMVSRREQTSVREAGSKNTRQEPSPVELARASFLTGRGLPSGMSASAVEQPLFNKIKPLEDRGANGGVERGEV